MKTICMKCQILFSGKSKKLSSLCHLLNLPIELKWPKFKMSSTAILIQHIKGSEFISGGVDTISSQLSHVNCLVFSHFLK